MAFDKKKYDNEYKKIHNKQFKALIKPEEMVELNELLEKNNLSKAQFIRLGLEKLRQKTKK